MFHFRLLVILIVLNLNIPLALSYPTLNSLLKKLNRHLADYERVSPFGDDYLSLDDFDLNRKERKILLSTDIDDFAINSDSIEPYYLIDFYIESIYEDINQILNHPKFTSDVFAQLIGNYSLAIIQSDDGKLFNFSIDEKTGGTYRSRFSWMHYLDDKNEDKIKYGEIYAVFSGDGFDAIYTLPTDEGVKYVLQGSVRGCSYCFESNIMLVSFDGNNFVDEFFYSVNSRSWEGGISYDAETLKIDVTYETDDLTPYCNCNEDEEGLEEDIDFDYSKSQICTCTFIFDGSTFVLKE